MWARRQHRLTAAPDRAVTPGRRGMRDQAERRGDEARVRRQAVAITRWASWQGIELAETADLIGICVHTLRDWQRRWRSDGLQPRERGAPVQRLSYDERVVLLALLDSLGPQVSHRTFAELAPPGIPRRELDRFLDRFRAVRARTRGQAVINALRWQQPGTVWAIDFTEPPTPIEGRYPWILIVRDLASGFQLASLPAPSAEADVVVGCLRELFAAHGAPLVLKSDNGSHFTAEAVQDLLRHHQVTWLPSPGYCPSYNGACEAGVGSIKTRAHHHAARHDRPEQWSCDDVEAARLEANHTGRPTGADTLGPDLRWRRRTSPDGGQRLVFRAHLTTMRTAAHEDWREAEDRPADAQPNHPTALALERQAITRSLIACDLLTIRRRRITLPNSRRWMRRIV